MGSGNNFTTDISQWLHIGTMHKVYRSTNNVDYNQQIVMHNARYTEYDTMVATLSLVTLLGWYDIDSVKVFNLLSAADKLRYTYSADLLRLHHCLKEPFFHPVSQQVQ
jgi:hypothetical protein